MTYLEKAKDLYAQLDQGKIMDAFEHYYHEDVVVKEVPTGELRNGKAAQRKALQEWMGSIKEQHGGGTGVITSNEDDGITTVESWTDVTFKDGNRMKLEEVAVQKWRDGQIVDERFYYNMPGQ